MSANNELSNTYFVKLAEGGNYIDVNQLVDGVRVLSITGFFEQGEPVNIYTAQWVDSQEEDCMVAHPEGTVIFKNVDIKVTFMVHQKYATNTIDVTTQHDAFVSYLTNGIIWVKSNYAGRQVKCVCLEKYEPTTVRLKRGAGINYMLGTITLHTLEKPT